MKTLTIYTDGACSGNPGPGGYAAIILENDQEVVALSGGEKQTTNNRMEMRSLIESLKYIQSKYTLNEVSLHIFIDSQYVMKGATEWMPGWKKKNWKTTTGPVKNKELWQEIDALLPLFQIKWEWVKGHDGNHYNEKADQLARNEVEKWL